MKILHINCVYDTGSTGKIVADIHSELQKNNIQSLVYYGRLKKSTDNKVQKICSELYAKANNLYSRITGLMYGGCFFSTNKMIRIIKKEQPDVVHLHCINGYFVNIYRLVDWLKKSNIKTILTLHAEFMYTANCGHALDCDRWKHGCGKCPRLKQETKSWFFDNTSLSFKKMKNAFSGFEKNLTVVSVSPWLMDRASQSPILKNIRHCTVLNGLNTDIFKPTTDTMNIRGQFASNNEIIIFHATPDFNDNPNHIKGGYYLLKLAELYESENVKFLVAGKHSQNLQVPKNVVLLGQISNQRELASYYSVSDITVITSKKETFSMVCAESLCCGTPVVGFQAGAPEQISLPKYSKFVPFGDVQALKKEIDNMIAKKYSSNHIATDAISKYSKKVMYENYQLLYQGK